MSDFLTTLRARLEARITERQAAKAEMDAILTAPTAEARDLNDDEAPRFAAAKDKVAAADADIAALQARVSELADIEGRQYEAAAKVSNVKVGREARTYTKEAERRDGVSFLRDVAAVSVPGVFIPGASERMGRHLQEEKVERGVEARAVGTSAFGNLIVPQYLVDQYAPYARAGRPFANLCRKHEMPAEGMTVELSRITTGTTTAVQSSQNSAASETNMDETPLSVAVQTIAGQQTVSRQALERGRITESVVLGDLMGSYNAVLDSTLINQATNGLDAITDANIDVAYTDASPTAAELWPKLFDTVQQVQTAVMGQATVDAMVMHPRRFWWLASQVGTSFPFVNLIGAGPQSGGAVNTTSYGAGPAGYLAGLPVYLDANIVTNGGAGTNEDRIYVIASQECHLWEDDVMMIRAEQTNAASLGVLYVLYNYVAYTFGRYPSANGRIAGTGLVTPTF